jgi:hypothetical protein
MSRSILHAPGTVDEVRNLGAVTTFGANDMVLDNWGRVEFWHAHGKVTSYGSNGIGFVNLGAKRRPGAPSASR